MKRQGKECMHVAQHKIFFYKYLKQRLCVGKVDHNFLAWFLKAGLLQNLHIPTVHNRGLGTVRNFCAFPQLTVEGYAVLVHSVNFQWHVTKSLKDNHKKTVNLSQRNFASSAWNRTTERERERRERKREKKREKGPTWCQVSSCAVVSQHICCEHGSVTAAFLRKNYCAAHVARLGTRESSFNPQKIPQQLWKPLLKFHLEISSQFHGQDFRIRTRDATITELHPVTILSHAFLGGKAL